MNMLFEPVRIKSMELRNRFVRSATADAGAEKTGHISERQIELFSELADGGVGLIITGIMYVHPSGCISLFHSSIANDDNIPALRKLTASVHKRGARIAAQLFHAGREAARFLNPLNKEAVAPSVISDDPYFTGKYRSMTESEIWDLIHAFGDAARRAEEAGFDAVQVHAAHAYLLSQFLSPHTNRRGDMWGGTLRDRLRFHHEVYLDIREKVGKDYPVLIKLGVQDGFPGGLAFTEGMEAAQLLARSGYDALEISQGLRGELYEGTEFRTRINCLDREAYFRQWCREIKRKVNVPVMMVGGFRSFELMEEVIQNNEADFISLCRPLIREPGIVNEWETGSRRKSTCVSCNKCLEGIRKGELLHCVCKKDGGQ
jgi:2,4-dienoyl-CoA reductase-like NADH-dependent reductase (Old Yellow Enzyme family)